RPVAEHPFFPALRLLPLAEPAPDDHELGCHSTGLSEETRALGLFEVAVEIARKHALETAVGQRELESVADHELSVRHPPPGAIHHCLALVEPDHLAPEVSRQEARAAGDVE